MSLKALVIDVGARLGRSVADVQPFLESLKENWYDSVDSVIDASADDLTGCGLPRRFAVELMSAAPAWSGGGGFNAPGDRGGLTIAQRAEEAKKKAAAGIVAAAAGAKGKDRKGKSKGKGKEDDEKGKKGGKGKARGGRSEVTATVPIDLDGLDPNFVFRPKILGSRGSHVHHIQDQTGASVELKGNDEDGYMEILITGQDQASVNKACSMCEDLVGTVFDEYDEQAGSGQGGKGKKGGKGDRFNDRDSKGKKGTGKDYNSGSGENRPKDYNSGASHHARYLAEKEKGKADRYNDRDGKGKDKDKGKGKGKDKGKKGKRAPEDGEIEERIPVDTESIDPDFHLRSKLVGEGGRNVKHIETETGCSVQVERDGEAITFILNSKSEDIIAAARDMCEDLISNILEDVGASSSKRPRGDDKGKGKKGGKAKGKGKRSREGDDERPRKAQKTDE